MQIVLDQADFAKMPPAILAGLLDYLRASTRIPPAAPGGHDGSADYDGIDMTDVADLDEEQVRVWMEAAQDKTKDGLRVIAEHGPIIDAWRLSDAGIDNIPHFQSRTTIRTRTVTKNKRAFLLSWTDHWEWDGSRPTVGRYAVSETTHRSLRRYFGLDD